MEVLEGLLKTLPASGDDLEGLLEIATLLGLSNRSLEVELLVAQSALDRGDSESASAGVLSLLRRDYVPAGRAAAVLAARGSLDTSSAATTELLAYAIAHCADRELPSVIDQWLASPQWAGMPSITASQERGGTRGFFDTVHEDTEQEEGNTSTCQAWLTALLSGCFSGLSRTSEQQWQLLPNVGDAALAIAVLSALQGSGAAALESFLASPAAAAGAATRAALLVGMFASGLRALEASDAAVGEGNMGALVAGAAATLDRLVLKPGDVLKCVSALPVQLPPEAEDARVACQSYQRWLHFAIQSLGH